jgi:hypothetical protein
MYLLYTIIYLGSAMFIGKFIKYLVQMSMYRTDIKILYDGRPKASYPTITKPTFFNKVKSKNNER